MERLTIDDLIARCNRQLDRLPSGNKLYQEHESTRAYLQILRHCRALGTVEHLTELVKAEQKRREGCGWCHDQQNLMYYKFNEYVICPHCGRDLRGESHDGD